MTLRRGVLLATATALVASSTAAGLALAGGDPGPVTVELTARHSAFHPSTVEVPEGSTVRFVIRNLDPIDHELIVGGPEVHRRHAVGRERHHHGDVPGEVSVPAGGTAATSFHFDAPGEVVFACHLPGHLDYGMSGVVVVSSRT